MHIWSIQTHDFSNQRFGDTLEAVYLWIRCFEFTWIDKNLISVSFYFKISASWFNTFLRYPENGSVRKQTDQSFRLRSVFVNIGRIGVVEAERECSNLKEWNWCSFPERFAFKNPMLESVQWGEWLHPGQCRFGASKLVSFHKLWSSLDSNSGGNPTISEWNVWS